MLTKWRNKRETKRIQAQCPHDWHAIRSFRGTVGDCVYTMEFVDLHDLYCPICNARRYSVSNAEMQRIEAVRQINRMYERGQNGEFRKGDVITCRN